MTKLVGSMCLFIEKSLFYFCKFEVACVVAIDFSQAQSTLIEVVK